MKYLIVKANVRYWEDAVVNGVEDTDGDMIPFRNGDLWNPVIEFESGKIKDWPEGVKADIHYKVCDEGEYFLSKDGVTATHKYYDCYAPDILSPLDNGYGDHIIMSINRDGLIKGWKNSIDMEEWIDLDL